MRLLEPSRWGTVKAIDLPIAPQAFGRAFCGCPIDADAWIEESWSTRLATKPEVIIYNKRHYRYVAEEIESELAQEFAELVSQWQRETFCYSSLSKQFSHPAYVRIMSMGKDGLPFVLNQLKKKSSDNWFYALRFMAGKAGKDVAVGIEDFEKARAAWLEWGHKSRYI